MQVSFTSLIPGNIVRRNPGNALKITYDPKNEWQAGGRKDEIPSPYSEDTFDRSHHKDDDKNNSAGMRVH